MRNAIKWAENAAGILPANRDITTGEMAALLFYDPDTAKQPRDACESALLAFYFGVAVAINAIKGGAICPDMADPAQSIDAATIGKKGEYIKAEAKFINRARAIQAACERGGYSGHFGVDILDALLSLMIRADNYKE